MTIHAQATKHVLALPSAGVDDGAFTAAAVDTLGYDYAQFIIQIGAIPAALAALKVTESDNNSDYTDVTGLDYASSLPETADKIHVAELNLRAGRKRYLKLVATAGDGSATLTQLSAVCNLTMGGQPVSATDRGAATLTQV